MEQLTEFVAKSFVPTPQAGLPVPASITPQTSPLTSSTPSPPLALPEVNEKCSEIKISSPLNNNNNVQHNNSVNSSLSTAYMISNLISNISPSLPPIAPTWPGTLYPLTSLFGGNQINDQLAGLHSKLAFNTMIERFQEIQHQLARSQQYSGQLFNYPQATQATIPTHTFPFLVARDNEISNKHTSISSTGKFSELS